MKIGYIVYLATSTLFTRKMRSFLTISGIAIGVGAIVFLVSLGFGLQKIIIDRVANVDALTILDVTTGASTLLKIDEESIDSFSKIEHVIGVSPSISQSGQIVREGTVTDLALYGIEPKSIELEAINPIFGEVFKEDTEKSIVIANTAAELLGATNAGDLVGQKVSIKIVVPVVNTEETQGEVESTDVKTESVELAMSVSGVVDSDSSLGYIPIQLFRDLGLNKYNLARVKVDNRENLQPVRTQIETTGFQVDSVADTVGQIDRIFLAFQFIMAGFGLIAMMVASLGAFNTLTVSLLERTREVGVMKSLGTKRKDVYLLFLTESVLIAVFGGTLGFLIGVGSGELVNFAINRLAERFGGVSVDLFSMPLIFVAMVVGVIFLVGIFTGFYPAKRASSLNPLDALRYE